MEEAKISNGRGRLITRDGSYRNGRYQFEARDGDAGPAELVSGSFEIDKGDVRPALDEEYTGAATLQLEDGQEVDVMLAGISDNLVVIKNLSPPARRHG